MTKSLFTVNERKEVTALAKELGYSGLRGYLRWLVEEDARKQGKSINLQDGELDHPIESFRRAWGEAMRGETMSYEEFHRRMEEDAD